MDESKSLTTIGQANPVFVEEQLKTLEGIMKYADTYIDSGLAPGHFKNPEAVVVCIQHGLSVGMNVSQALQQIIPINGLTSIKGDGAKALIMGSGKCSEWKETKSGSLKEGDYAVTIYSKRKDTGEEMEYTFSINHAKRAGLWISTEAANKNPKLKYSPWFKYPDRMIRYRALGFIARDLYSDVLQGLVTEEEAKDYPDTIDVAAEVVNDEGKKVEVKAVSTEQTESTIEKMTPTSAVAAKTKEEEKDTSKEPKKEEQDILDVIDINDVSEEQLHSIEDIEDLKKIATALLGDLDEAIEGQRKTKPKLISAIMSYLQGPEDDTPDEGKETEAEEAREPASGNERQPEESTKVEKPPFSPAAEQAGPPSKQGLEDMFDSIRKIGDPQLGGSRTFDGMKDIYELLEDNGYDDATILDGINALGLDYSNKEKLCQKGTCEEIIQVIEYSK